MNRIFSNFEFNERPQKSIENLRNPSEIFENTFNVNQISFQSIKGILNALKKLQYQ